MLPRNPFNTTYAEMINSSDSFLSLYDYSLLSKDSNDNRPFVFHEMFSQVVIFSSSPGGGKSSLFHLFSPDILNTVVVSKEQYEDIWSYLFSLNAIDEKGVNLLGVEFSCARNYSIIEDVFDKRFSQQIFFALLNVRLLKEALKSILVLNKATKKDLGKITFTDMPEEITSFIDVNWDGRDIYNWACKQEKELCFSIDNMDESIKIDSMHSYLSIIQLFDASKILYDGKRFIKKVLFLLDDIHKLTTNQRAILKNSLFVVRNRPGVWLAQRSYALNENEILGPDATVERDYYFRQLENQEDIGKNSKFNKALISVANKRAKAYSVDIPSFSSCISNSININSVITKTLQKALNDILSYTEKYISVDTIKSYIHSDSLYDKVVLARVVKILIDRKKNKSQLALVNSFYEPTQEELKKMQTDASIKNAAEYYLAVEYCLPYYFGIERLQLLSFGNIYQFLSYCGAIFERKISYAYNKKRMNSKVTATEQDQIIRRVSKQRWEELDVLYVNSKRIKQFISNVVEICVHTRELGAASYNGGTFTGIGIKEDLFRKILESHPDIKKLLAECVSANIIKKRTIKQGTKGERVEVFYLNRWLCVYFNLPLAYGGWKPCSCQLLEHLFNDDILMFKNFYLLRREQFDE